MSAAIAGTRIAIIGAGSVGSTCAYALLLRPIASEILLFDIDTLRLHAQVQDLSDAAFLGSAKIRSSTLAEAGQCNMIVITAGAKSRENESRRNLIDRNYVILDSVIQGMRPIRKDAVLLLVSNPVDVLAHFAQKMSGLPHAQVIGSGTFLDSVRLRSALAEPIEVAGTAVRAYVLGEHGDSQMVAWSSATVGGSPIQNFFTPASLSDIANSAKNKAYSIIAAKGATAYGIASIVSSICESILLNQRHIRPISHWVESLETYVSLPAVLGHGGVQKTIDIPLDESEKELLQKSAEDIRSNMKVVGEQDDTSNPK